MLGSSQHSSSSDRVDITVNPHKLKCLINNERDHTLSSNVTRFPNHRLRSPSVVRPTYPNPSLRHCLLACFVYIGGMSTPMSDSSSKRMRKGATIDEKIEARSVTKLNVSQDWPWISRRGETLVQWILQGLNVQKVRWVTNVQVAYRCQKERSNSGWREGTAMHKSHMRRHL